MKSKASVAQIAASERAWNEALGSVEGRFVKGQIVVDYATGKTWRLTRAGRRYHEDCSSLMYPAVPCRAPRDYQDSERLGEIIEMVLREGTQEPGSRSARFDGSDQPCPPGTVELRWQKAPSFVGSLASMPSLAIVVGEHTYLRAVHPGCDGDTVMAWMALSPSLLLEVRKLVARTPRAQTYPRVHVKLRAKVGGGEEPAQD